MFAPANQIVSESEPCGRGSNDRQRRQRVAPLVSPKRVELSVLSGNSDRLQVLANASVIVADEEVDTTEVATFEILAVPATPGTASRNGRTQTYWVAANISSESSRHLLDLSFSGEGLLVAGSHIWYPGPGAPLELFIRFELHSGTYTIKVNGIRAVEATSFRSGREVSTCREDDAACQLGPICLTLVEDAMASHNALFAEQREAVQK